jgi:hypothetical protein
MHIHDHEPNLRGRAFLWGGIGAGLLFRLANFCYPDDRFEAELATLTAQILANSWYSNQVNKRALIEIDGLSLRNAHRLDLFKNEGLAPDAAKRLSAFFKDHGP